MNLSHLYKLKEKKYSNINLCLTKTYKIRKVINLCCRSVFMKFISGSKNDLCEKNAYPDLPAKGCHKKSYFISSPATERDRERGEVRA